MPTTVLTLTATGDDGCTNDGSPSAFINNDVRAGVTLSSVYHAGWRFPGVAIPKGATVSASTFTPKGTISTPSGSQWGEYKTANSGNVAAWATTNNPKQIAKNTTGAVAVTSASSVTGLSAALQAVFAHASWASGNALAIVIDGTTANGAWLAGDVGAGGSTGLSITWDYPALTDTTLSTTTAYDDASAGEILAAIGGTTSGSTLALTDASGLFAITGSNLTSVSTLTPGSYSITITETLVGAPGSPHATNFAITVSAAPSLRFIAASSGTTSATIPTHKVGDLILAFCFRDGSATLPTLPTGQDWTQAISHVSGAFTCSMRLASKIADTTTEATGTFTSASSLLVHVYRPGPGVTLSIGDAQATTNSSTTVSYPALTLTDGDGSSWVVGFSGHKSVNTTLESPPTGMVNRSTVVDATDEAAGHDTNGGVSSWSLTTKAVGGTAAGWMGSTVEIIVTLPGTPSGSADITTEPATVSSTGTLALTGAVSVTLDPATVSAAGKVSLQAQSSTTLDPATVSSTSRLALKGSVAVDLDPATVQASGASSVRGSSSIVLDDAVTSAAGRIALSGTAAITLDPATVSSTSTLLIRGSAAIPLDPATMVSQGEAPGGPVAGTSAILLDDAATSAAGRLLIKGSASLTLDPATVSSTSVSSLKAQAAVVLDPATVSSTGRLRNQGSASLTLDPAVIQAVGTSRARGVVAVTLDDAAVNASGRLSVRASGSVVLDPATVASSAVLASLGQGDITLDDASLAAAAQLSLTASADITLEPAYVVARGNSQALLPVPRLRSASASAEDRRAIADADNRRASASAEDRRAIAAVDLRLARANPEDRRTIADTELRSAKASVDSRSAISTTP